MRFKLTPYETEGMPVLLGKAWDEGKHPRDDRGRFGEGGKSNDKEIKKEGSPTVTKERLRKERKYYGYEEIVGGGSKGLLVHMSPDKFLQLAASSYGDAKIRATKYGKFDEKKFNEEYLPHLDIDENGNVKDHEGRARAEMLKRDGFALMPVVIASKSRKHKDEDFPRKLKSEDESVEFDRPKGMMLTV